MNHPTSSLPLPLHPPKHSQLLNILPNNKISTFLSFKYIFIAGFKCLQKSLSILRVAEDFDLQDEGY
jgi:hypothetical protein